MNIDNLEYIAPSKSHQLGSISFKATIPIVFAEGMKEVSDEDSANVELSTETVNLLEQAADSIIKDITK